MSRTWLFLFLFSVKCLTGQEAQPNILWIVCEDISPTLSMYGDSTAATPNLDSFAQTATRYENAFAPVGVCAPARSSLITGMYPTSIGTMHMRTGKDVFAHGKRTYKSETGRADINGTPIGEYAAVTPPEVRCFTEYLRAAGYFCTNNAKTDYQFAAPLTAWDENGNHAHWRHRPEGRPFFSVFNIGLTHESQLWRRAAEPLTVAPENAPLPPYLVDCPSSRGETARHYSNVEAMDAEFGKILAQLKADSLFDNTIVFFYSDHGGPLPRQKREANDRGLRVPLLLKYIGQKEAKTERRLVSFVDFAPTLLDMANVGIPEHMQGFSFFKKNADPRGYIFGSGDRFDEYSDRIRTIRTDSFLYVQNLRPDLPNYKEIGYRKQLVSMQDLLAARDSGLLNEAQAIWFAPKAHEELYLPSNDPHNLHNLALDPAFHKELLRHRALLENHLLQYGDMAEMPEAEMLEKMWPKGQQPRTKTPELRLVGGKLEARCSTEGSSIAYLITDEPVKDLDRDLPWQLYTKPLVYEKRKHYAFVAERIGFETSELLNME